MSMSWIDAIDFGEASLDHFHEWPQGRVHEMLLGADSGDRRAALKIVSKMLSMRRFGHIPAALEIDRLLVLLDELELLFSLELSAIEDSSKSMASDRFVRMAGRA